MKTTKLLLALFVALASTCNTYAQRTEVIAHRGYWKTAGSAQNSLASIREADRIACYGSELDVWMTSDKVLVVNHDRTFKGVTIQDASLKTCSTITLDNGEQLPTLRQYLKKARKLQVKIILELKSHRTPEQETEACRQITEMVSQLHLEDRMEYIAFSLHATKELIRLAPQGTPVYYLNGDLNPSQLKAIGCAGPDYHIKVFKEHPEWIDECHRLGMKVNVWTVDNPDDMDFFIEKGVDFITTNEPVLLQTKLEKL
ncbi:MAG: glycerophosphodiester phosphodiesterase family protein [Bacteroidales bacterium]|nr:glycerophosphodiester phosphodiesterase family protein [Bacteroidales bacterium]